MRKESTRPGFTLIELLVVLLYPLLKTPGKRPWTPGHDASDSPCFLTCPGRPYDQWIQ
ncbi:MAG: prepilin-type N-terminal cleavage/methylation domain-containing protein [Gemmataceae bacterium]|nr:prepilin-type N-terminal cleavage/methylation domain-containing protein [Gemmataceae bacterium]